MTEAGNTTAVIRLDGVSYAYPGGSACIENLSLSVNRGERVCLLGGNGSGKSTLLKLFAGLLEPSAGRITVGDAIMADNPRRSELRRLMGFVFQNPEDQILSTTVEMDVAFALENLGVSQEEMRQQVDACLRRFGLAELRKRHPLTLSAGEKQRTALASVMVVEPQILLMDEPTSFLDYRGRRLLEAVVFENRTFTIVGATQYLGEVDLYDRVVFLESGRAPFCGSIEEFKHSEYWQQMIQEPSGESGSSSCVPFALAAPTLDGALQLENISFEFSVGRRVLDQICITVPFGKITAVLGDSGCGKTTLALLLAGLVEPSTGSITINDRVIAAEELSKQTAVLFQFPETGFFAENVLEEVGFGIRQTHADSLSFIRKVQAALELVGMDFDLYSQRSPFQLSAGEQRRVAIASALIMERPVIVFDETTLGLDWEGRSAMAQFLRNLKAAGKTIVLMTHDIEFTSRTADNVVLMDNGGIVWQGVINATEIPQRFLMDHFGIETLIGRPVHKS